MFKTEPLYSSTPASGSSNKNLNNLLADDDEPQGEPPGFIQQILSFFSKLWSPSTSDAEKLGFSYVYAEDGSLLGEYGSGGSNSSGTAQYSACGVARCPAQKTASFRPALRCKSSRYLRVSLWFAPCPDQKSIGFQRAAQHATPHDLPTASGPMPIAAVIKGQTYAVHSDHLNTPRILTQPDGQVAWQWAYSAFGDEQPTIGAKRFTSETTTPTTGATSIPEVTFNLRYPGQYFDAETKLHYNYFRTYAPGTGRYTQGDPIGLDGGFNRFGYVGGNPLSFVDPMGLWITATYDQKTGNLYVYDDITGTMTTGRFESGGKPWGDPIPNGDYDLLGHPDPDFFRLEPVDFSYGDDADSRTSRDKFRLHKPGRTLGCIAATDRSNWDQIRDRIRNTKTRDQVPVNSKSRNPFSPKMETLPRYGRLTVVNSN